MEGTRNRRSLGAIVGVLTLGIAMLLALGMSAARAETGMKALILESTVSGGAASLEATNATGNGFAVTLVDETTWGSMTAA